MPPDPKPTTPEQRAETEKAKSANKPDSHMTERSKDPSGQQDSQSTTPQPPNPTPRPSGPGPNPAFTPQVGPPYTDSKK